MFDLGYFELFLIAIITLIVVGPKDLPKVMRVVGRMVGKVRATARQFKSGMDDMIRQAELEEMRETWDKHNADIMKAYPDGAPTIPGADLAEPTATPPAQGEAPKAVGAAKPAAAKPDTRTADSGE